MIQNSMFKIQSSYFRTKLLLLTVGILLFFPVSAPASIQGPYPKDAGSPEIGHSNLQALLSRLALLEEPVSREGTGLLVAQAPGERYRLQFRLLARGPEAFRLEIFDPFGRPMLYIVSYLGKTRVFSIAEQKEIPLPESLSGPLGAFSQMPFTEISKIFWGRVPIFPYDSYQIQSAEEEGKETVKILLQGAYQQEIWIRPNPFSLIKSRIKSPSKEGEIELTFSDFSRGTSNRLPLRLEIKDGTGENALSLLYETLILRPDIPDEVFKWPEFIRQD